MLGQDLFTLLGRDGEEVARYSRRDRDITDAAAIEPAVRERKPAVVVNCAAWTGVDVSEADEDAALQVNGHAVAALATACADYGSTPVHMSTDYLLDGTAQQPHGGANRPSPRTAYGRGKPADRRVVLDLLVGSGPSYVVRTA